MGQRFNAVALGWIGATRSAQPPNQSTAQPPDQSTAQTDGPLNALVLGEALIDLVPDSSGTIHPYPGGSPLNVAVTLGRLGRPTYLGAHLGQDAYGRLIKRHLSQSGAKLLPGSDQAERTSTAQVQLDPTGQAVYQFDFAWQTPPIPPDLHPKPAVIHTGSLAATVEPGGRQLLDLYGINPLSATLSFDPNVRPAAMGPAAHIRPRIEAMVALSDVVKASDEDLAYLYPALEPLVAAQRWAATGPALVVLTKGAAGAQAVTATGLLVNQAGIATQVADSVGAGDAFMGAVIDALWHLDLLGAERVKALAGIDPPTISQVLTHAVRVAAMTVARSGANPPWRHEL